MSIGAVSVGDVLGLGQIVAYTQALGRIPALRSAGRPSVALYQQLPMLPAPFGSPERPMGRQIVRTGWDGQ